MSNKADPSRDCSHTYNIKAIPIHMKRTTAVTFDGGSLITGRTYISSTAYGLPSEGKSEKRTQDTNSIMIH